jgi:hypothetical protein
MNPEKSGSPVRENVSPFLGPDVTSPVRGPDELLVQVSPLTVYVKLNVNVEELAAVFPVPNSTPVEVPVTLPVPPLAKARIPSTEKDSSQASGITGVKFSLNPC